jgi:CBS domain-containing protein
MKFDQLTVADLMSTGLITAGARDAVDSADADMATANIRHLPVVDDRGRLVGIVSHRDIRRGARGKKTLVGDVMTTRVRTVTPQTPARAAAETLLEHKIGALPVVGDEMQLVGIVTETDFLQIAVRAMGGHPLR